MATRGSDWKPSDPRPPTDTHMAQKLLLADDSVTVQRVIELREAESWVPVGNCGFHKIDWRNRSAELGIFIGEKSYWSQGYGTEAMRLLLKHGFETLNLNRIFLRVFNSNLRAIRSYEKAGFIAEGKMRQAEFRRGAYKDVILMSVLRSEWDGARGSEPGA